MIAASPPLVISIGGFRRIKLMARALSIARTLFLAQRIAPTNMATEHMSGIIAGAGWFSTGSNFTHTFKGIAPNANIINLRVLDQNGAGTDSSVIAAIQTAINLKSTYNIRVISLSLGRQVYESYQLDPLCQAVEAAWNAGIVVLAAAGNQGRNNTAGTEGYGTIAAPGNDP